MLISYAKEAKIFFEVEVPFTATKLIAKDFAKKNSLYTWYVTYIDVYGIDEMDFILFVNGQTGFPVILPESAMFDWSDNFSLALMRVFHLLGVKDKYVRNYLETFPEFVTMEDIPPIVGHYFSQYKAFMRQPGVVEDFLEDEDKDFEDLSLDLAESLILKDGKSAAISMKEVFRQTLPPLYPISRKELYQDDDQIDLKDELGIRKSYRPFLALEDDLPNKKIEELKNQYIVVTEKVLGDFEDYLKNEVRNSEEIIQRDMGNITRFLKEQQREDGGIETPIFSMDELFGAHVFLKSTEPLTDEKIKGLTNSLRHFYKFLYEKEAITKKEWQEAKEIILIGENLVYSAIQYDTYS